MLSRCEYLYVAYLKCARSALDCVFPARKRTRKPRQARQSELLNRIHRLESIVGKVESAVSKPPLGTFIKVESGAPHTQEQTESPGNTVTNAGPATTSSSRETSVAPNNYLSSDFWSNLCDEVDGIKQALDQESESDKSDDDEGLFFSSESPSQTHSSPGATSGLIMTFSGDINPYGPQHPSQAQIRHLSRTYFTNVDPVIKILHRPTAPAELSHFADSLDAKTISNDTAALFFAMYYAAATSMSHEECLVFLSEDRSTILPHRPRPSTRPASAYPALPCCAPPSPSSSSSTMHDSTPQAARFHWWYDMYPQWHPLAVALAELCAQTEGELVDRAWVVVEGAVPRLESMVADTRKGPLWRPVKKLLKKARGLRAEALNRRGSGVTDAPHGTSVAVVEENNDSVTDVVMLPAATQLSAEPYAADAGDAQADLSFLGEPWQWDNAQELYDEWVAPVEGGDPSMDWTTWNEFLADAQVEGSPSE
ncbi:conserved hypothetical protein [Verticillium alfalfae VaMs.102]|uniref:Fungal specific transcription factor domain-containing protein n=1 Tax=Verticillium alfalfae (strain VaMs.102 / ATCC MYA-4576 / FGSC 10136) TaxID=526221 RepID=C9SEV8_VERA1|nr:conserved hypothetical protein [Verticillium alfalfae VaMs.102]EEY17744.1 conserved hypothetical protein [Verticillium alfalfae VaMs.102]